MTDVNFNTPKPYRKTSSLEKLNKAASEGRFRIKSLMRVKTI